MQKKTKSVCKVCTCLARNMPNLKRHFWLQEKANVSGPNNEMILSVAVSVLPFHPIGYYWRCYNNALFFVIINFYASSKSYEKRQWIRFMSFSTKYTTELRKRRSNYGKPVIYTLGQTNRTSSNLNHNCHCLVCFLIQKYSTQFSKAKSSIGNWNHTNRYELLPIKMIKGKFMFWHGKINVFR